MKDKIVRMTQEEENLLRLIRMYKLAKEEGLDFRTLLQTIINFIQGEDNATSSRPSKTKSNKNK